MIAVDANLLIYAHVSTFPQHKGARDWLDIWLNGTIRVGIPWPNLLAFVRLVSNPRIFERPEPVSKAWRQVEEWLDCGPVWIPQPTDAHRQVLRELIPYTGEKSSLVSDAHIAALAIEHGLKLFSTDGDFARFPGLQWENPLQS